MGRAYLSVIALERSVVTGLFEVSRDSARELAFLIGYAHPVVGRWQATGAVGLAGVRTYRHQAGPCLDAGGVLCVPTDGGRRVSPVLAGLPVEIGIHGPVAGAFGVGLRAFVNVNVDERYGGLSVSLLLNPARREQKPR